MLRYAGIGSRETPQAILEIMRGISYQLGKSGWLLRSGYAPGADFAFYEGAAAASGDMENFLPWEGFNGAPRRDPRFIVPQGMDRMMKLAAKYHPYWDRCSPGAKKLHARNGCQILGLTLDDPVDMVVCWTKGGDRGGGTGQALRIAEDHKIPIFDLALHETYQKLVHFVDQKEKST